MIHACGSDRHGRSNIRTSGAKSIVSSSSQRRNEKIEEIFKRKSSPKTRSNQSVLVNKDKVPSKAATFQTNKSNRSCSVNIEQIDFAQTVDLKGAQKDAHVETYQQILHEQFGFDPAILPCQQMRNVETMMKILTESQDDDSMSPKATQPDIGHWQNVDSPEDVDKYLDPVSLWHDRLIAQTCDMETVLPSNNNKPTTEQIVPVISKHSLKRDQIWIAETPKVKVIAEKYSKLAKGNIEIRKLEEKIVCVEYDVYDKMDMRKPKQKLRSFFSIKPLTSKCVQKGDEDKHHKSKMKFHIDDVDLKRLTNKEIEIIDGKVEQNESYLKDLRKILHQKTAAVTCYNPNHCNVPELMNLYDLAYHDTKCQNHISKTKVITNGRLEEIKDLILNMSASSAYGFDRHKLRPEEFSSNFTLFKDSSIISQSFFNELLRETSKAF